MEENKQLQTEELRPEQIPTEPEQTAQTQSVETEEIMQEAASVSEDIAVAERVEPETIQEPIMKNETKKKVEKPQKIRRRPHFALRMLMQILSVLICCILTIGLLVPAVLIDVRTLTSSGTIQTVLNAYLSAGKTVTPSAASPSGKSDYLVRTDFEIPGDFEIPDDFEILDDIEIPDDLQIPDDILTNPDALTDFVYDVIQEVVGEESEIEISREQIQEVLDKSTVTDYLSEKAASYIDDVLTGEESTTITTEEIMDLLEENQTLIEDTFQIEVSEQIKENIRTQVDVVIVEQDINTTIRQEINKVREQPISENSDMTIGDIMLIIGEVTQTSVILMCVVACLLLVGLLFAANFYNLPMGLTWASIGFLVMGMILSAPLVVLEVAPDLLPTIIPELAAYVQTINDVVATMAPVHYGMAILGFVMLVMSVVWRILARNLRRKHVVAA